MPVIATRQIKRTRRWHRCNECGSSMKRGQPAMALYGMAFRGDKPYWIYVCDACAKGESFQASLAGTERVGRCRAEVRVYAD